MNLAQMHIPNTWPQSAWRSAALALGAAALLSACGGGQGDPAAPASAKSAQLAQDQDENPTHSAPTRLHAQGAALNSAELQRAAQSAPAGLDAGKAMAQAAASALINAHRFYNTQTGAHFYTTSEEEKTSVQNTLPQFQYEGPAFYASGTAAEGLSPVHRFFNTQTGVHFYTVSEDEKASVQAHLPQYRYEGVGFYASKVAGTDLVQLYRFYLAGQGSHFYTTSQTERDSVIAHLPPYTDEGVGFYVLAPGWGQPQPVQAIFFDPSPYLSSDDIPALFYGSGGPTVLEDFEDGTLDASLSASTGSIIGQGLAFASLVDSVDADDGAIDGTGTGRSWFSGSGSAGVSFGFNGAQLPTAFGLVWTDGSGSITISATDGAGNSLGSRTFSGFPDGSNFGTTAEDRFLGVQFSGGIGSIFISNSSGGIEIDHVQYGAMP